MLIDTKCLQYLLQNYIGRLSMFSVSTTASRTFELGVYSAVSWLLQHEIRILSCKFFSYHGATQARLEEEKQHVFWILQSSFSKLVLSLSLDGSQGWICQKCSAFINIDKSWSECWIYQKNCNSGFASMSRLRFLVIRSDFHASIVMGWDCVQHVSNVACDPDRKSRLTRLMISWNLCGGRLRISEGIPTRLREVAILSANPFEVECKLIHSGVNLGPSEHPESSCKRLRRAALKYSYVFDNDSLVHAHCAQCQLVIGRVQAKNFKRVCTESIASAVHGVRRSTGGHRDRTVEFFLSF